MSSSDNRETPSSHPESGDDDEARTPKTRTWVKQVVCLWPGTEADKNDTWPIPRKQNRARMSAAGLTGEITCTSRDTLRDVNQALTSLLRPAFDLKDREPLKFHFLCVLPADSDKRLQLASMNEGACICETVNRCSGQGSLYVLPAAQHKLRKQNPKLPPAADKQKASSAEGKKSSSDKQKASSASSSKLKTPHSSRICKTFYSCSKSEDQDQDEARPLKVKSWVRKIVCLWPGTNPDRNHSWAIPRKQNRAQMSAAGLTGEITYSSRDTDQHLQEAVESVFRRAFHLKDSEPFHFQFLSVRPGSDKRLHMVIPVEGEARWNCEAVNQCSGQGCLYILPATRHKLRKLEPRLAARGLHSAPPPSSTPASSSELKTPLSSSKRVNVHSSGQRETPCSHPQSGDDDEARTPPKTRRRVKQVVCLRPGTDPDENHTWAIPRKRNRELMSGLRLTGELKYSSHATHQQLRDNLDSLLRPAFDLEDSEPFRFQLLSATLDDARKRLQIASTDGGGQVRLSSEMVNRCSGQGCLYVLPDPRHQLREECEAPEVPELCRPEVADDQALIISFLCQVCCQQFYFKSSVKIYDIVHMGSKHHEIDYGGKNLLEVVGETFEDKSSLNEHEVTRASREAFKRGACHQTVLLARSLQRRSTSQTLQKPVRCGACDKPLASGFHAKKHRIFNCPREEPSVRRARRESETYFSSTVLRRYRLVCGAQGRRKSLASLRALWSMRYAARCVRQRTFKPC